MAKKSAKSVVKKKTKNTSNEKKEVEVSSEKVNESRKTVKDSFFDVNLLKKITPILLILFAMAFAFYVRSGPITLNGLEAQVEANVYSQIQSIISQKINLEYPNLDPTYKQELLQKEYQKVLDTGEYELNGQKIVIKDIATQNTKVVKDAFKSDNNQTYLNAIDPYHFMRYSELYAGQGYIGTSLKEVGGKQVPWIDYKLAPNGVPGTYSPDFHVWLESTLFKLNGIDVNSSVGEKTSVIFLLPVIFAMLCVIPLFIILRKYSNDIFALLGSLFLVSVGTFVSRTIAGFVDTDAYNVFFPLLIVACIIFAFNTKNTIHALILGFLAGFFQSIFLWAWGPGWFIFTFSVFALLGTIGYFIILNIISKDSFSDIKNSIKNKLYIFLAFVVSAYLFTWIVVGYDIFKRSYDSIFASISSIATISGTNIWPNVLSSVAELNPASFSDILSSIGNAFVFFLGMMGLVLLSIDFKSKEGKSDLWKRGLVLFSIVWFVLFSGTTFFIPLAANHALLFLLLLFLPVGLGLILSLFDNNDNLDKVFLTIILSVWIAGTIYMSLNGVRFILLLAPAFAIAFALGLFYVANIINIFVSEEFKLKNNITKKAFGIAFSCIVFLIIFSPMVSQASKISKSTTPNFDDAWYGSMYKIKNNSSSDAIITSWWDFGHFFAAISQRSVTFDGGSQSTPQAHWVGKLLMENDEEVSHDILQMLVCGGNKAFEYMLNITKDDTNGVLVNKVIYSTFGKTDEEKIEVLKNNKYFEFTNSQIEDIMVYLACQNPRENFLITSEDMIGKAGVWAHWGSWDFLKKYTYDNYKTMSISEIAKKIDENESLISKYVDELKQIDISAKTQNIKRENLVNQWLAPYPSYIPIQGQYLYPCQMSNTTMTCQNGVIINLEDGSASSSFGDSVVFKNLVLPSTNGLRVIEQNPKGNVDLVFVPSSSGYSVLLTETPLGASLFTKLFYLNGFGTKYFEKFDDVNSVTGIRVITWKVKWNSEFQNAGNLTNVSINESDISVDGNNLSNSQSIVENQTSLLGES